MQETIHSIRTMKINKQTMNDDDDNDNDSGNNDDNGKKKINEL